MTSWGYRNTPGWMDEADCTVELTTFAQSEGITGKYQFIVLRE